MKVQSRSAIDSKARCSTLSSRGSTLSTGVWGGLGCKLNLSRMCRGFSPTSRLRTRIFPGQMKLCMCVRCPVF